MSDLREDWQILTGHGRALSKDEEVVRLASFLTERPYGRNDMSFRDGQIGIKGGSSLSKRKDGGRDIDLASLTLDTKTKTASLYTAKESHHNGDHYDCKTEDVDWDASVTLVLEKLKPLALDAMREDIKKRKERQLDDEAQTSLEKLLGRG